MLDLMSGFVVELRNAGLPVSLTENLDAMEAVKHIPIEDRDAFKYALAATWSKTNSIGKPSRLSLRFISHCVDLNTTFSHEEGEIDEDSLKSGCRGR